MKEYRFTRSNGSNITATLPEFVRQNIDDFESKGPDFEPICKRVTRNRYNSMGVGEQKAYEAKRKYSKPTFGVWTKDGCVYKCTREEYDMLELPVQNKIKTCFFVNEKDLVLPSFFYSKRQKTEYPIDSIAGVYQKKACEFARKILVFAGWINSLNWYSDIDFIPSLNHTTCRVKVNIGENTFNFQFDGALAINGIDFVKLETIEKNEERVYCFYSRRINSAKDIGNAIINNDCKDASCYFGY